MQLALFDRMLLREMLPPLGVGLLGILQLLVVLQLLQLNEVVFSSAVTLADIGRVAAAFAPHFLVMAVPLAYMLGIQLGLGRLSGDQELLALAAAGRSPLRLYRVPVALACALGLGVAALAAWAEPWGLREVSRVLNHVIKRNLQNGLLPGVFNEQLPRFTIYVAEAEGLPGRYADWRGVLIQDDLGDGAPLLALAETGRIEDAGGEALRVRLERGELHRTEPRGETVIRFAGGSFIVGVQESVARKNRFSSIEGAMSYRELGDRASQWEAEGFSREAARLRLEQARRWAVPLGCLAFVLLGIPLAVLGSGARGAAYLVTLGAFAAFYVLSRLGVAVAEKGFSPWLSAFLPDLTVAAAGAAATVWLARRGVRKPRV